MKPRDKCGNKWSLFIKKIIIDPLVIEQNYSLMIVFYQWNIAFELPVEADQYYNN